ncbi:MAG: polysaccharide deacetylase family protein [Pseudomonadota bacterium]
MSFAASTKLLTLLRGMHVIGAHRWAAQRTRGLGAILMLHQVCPPTGRDFEPSRILQVTPEFLDDALTLMRREHFEFIPLDAVPQRIKKPTDRPFACLTLDDGYRDNLEHALPVFRAHNAPFAIYLPDTFADGDGDVWWLTLEAVIRSAEQLTVTLGENAKTFQLTTHAEKSAAHGELYWALRNMDEPAARAIVASLADEHGVDASAIAAELLMTWDEVRRIAADPLCTIAAHTSRHFAAAKLDLAELQTEIMTNAARLEHELGKRPRHFSYPYGCAQSAGRRDFDLVHSLGFDTAVTTRKGMIFPEHADHMTALPRLSLNGDYQDVRALEVLLSGLPFALRNRGRRLDVA